MNLIKRLGIFCAVLVVTGITTAARAQLAGNWTYSWGSSIIGEVYDGYNGYGGLFADSALVDNIGSVSNPLNVTVATGSYCNDLNEDISTNQTVSPTTVYQFDQLTSAQIGTNSTNGTLLSYGQGPTAFDAYTPIAEINNGPGTLSGATKLDALEYLVATNWNAALADNTGVTASNLQLAIWQMWGYPDPPTTYTSASEAMVTTAEEYVAGIYNGSAYVGGQAYANDGVLWVYNSPTQNQIMYDPTISTQSFITPEGASLALLLPGLLPIGLVIRRKVSKA